MYLEHSVVLPGGFRLPIKLVEEQWVSYEKSASTASAENADNSLADFAQEYLRSLMVAGTVLTRNESVELLRDFYCMRGTYTCHEMIGRVQSEEILNEHGKSD